METMREAIAEYITDLKLQGVSFNTADSYERDLRRLADYFENEKFSDFRLITETDLHAYIRWMEKISGTDRCYKAESGGIFKSAQGGKKHSAYSDTGRNGAAAASAGWKIRKIHTRPRDVRAALCNRHPGQ